MNHKSNGKSVGQECPTHKAPIGFNRLAPYNPQNHR